MHTSITRAPFALILTATLAASYLGAVAPARAQDDASAVPPAAGAPPAVARLSVVDGQVALKHGDSADQAAATANAPVVAGDYITTGDDGHAEVQLDSANLVRAGAGTQLRFTQLDGANDVAQIAQGSVELRVFATGQDKVQVQTPSVDVEPSDAGVYLVTVTSDGNTQVTARSGSLAVVTPQGTQEVDPGRTMVVAGAATNPQYQYIDEVAQSDVEAWGGQRDQMLAAGENAQSQYVPSDMTGTADLNQYGNWVNIPGYGDAWVPSGVAPGWTPYSAGSWVSLNYYGPTWVAAEPWGWAPYHYGRWLYAPTVGWAWTPGPRYARPTWSPALVAFFGFGGGVGVGVGFSNVGWVPLAPGESYRPWWGRGASLSFGGAFNNYRNYAHGFVGVSYDAWQHGSTNRAQPMSVAQLQTTHFYQGNVATSSFAARYTSRSLASNVPKAEYQRFNEIRPAINHSVTPSGWQRFSGEHTANVSPNNSPGWQRFNGGAMQQRYPSYARPSNSYQQQPQRQYGSYPQQQQRQYGSYQQQQQRQYQSYPQQRQYAQPQQRQYPSYGAPRQYQSYPAQRQYAQPQQRTQYYRPQQQSSRSAPSHTSTSGNHPRGPGRP
jgi:hypothetical protein